MSDLFIVDDCNLLPNEYLLLLERNSIFVSQSYLSNYVENPFLLYIYNEEYIVLVEIKKKYVFKYACIYSELIPLGASSHEKKAFSFLNEVCDKLENQYGVQWISSVLPRNLSVAYPVGASVIPFGSYVIDLNLSLDELWKNVHSKHRNSIRRAEKNLVVIKYGIDLLDDFVELDKITWERSNHVGNNKDFYSHLLDSMRTNALLAVVYKNGVANGGGIFLYNTYSCYYLYGASLNDPEPGAMNYLHWEVIKKMKDLGMRQYDFVGCRINEDPNSKYHGIQNFKKRFGGFLKRGFLYRKVKKRFYYFLYVVVLSLKQRRVYKDIVSQEYYKWKKGNYDA